MTYPEVTVADLLTKLAFHQLWADDPTVKHQAESKAEIVRLSALLPRLSLTSAMASEIMKLARNCAQTATLAQWVLVLHANQISDARFMSAQTAHAKLGLERDAIKARIDALCTFNTFLEAPADV